MKLAPSQQFHHLETMTPAHEPVEDISQPNHDRNNNNNHFAEV
jgi:hypothetical protein